MNDVPANLNAEIPSNGAWLRISWIGLSQHHSACFHHIEPLPDHGDPGRPVGFRTIANLERTFIAIKPDGVQRGLVGEIIKRFEQKGFRLVAMKFLRSSEEHLKQHYIDLKDRPFFPGLVKYKKIILIGFV
ncbi:nucleoside diphosphate kinase B-like [Meriones unguiculatus]|uniref:nucleoside diphosphate kinase B-like n=1 Tax=Meriones unguiculatus TaxID=10047 RepID=UPI00108F78CE|nr:nucleoside diphosphate kinase B-like [Meriones unguiculatus]